jgi:cysteinyl-tRNA synthetase
MTTEDAINIAKARNAARKNKNYKESDRLRKLLLDDGFRVGDMKTKTQLFDTQYFKRNNGCMFTDIDF